MESLKLRVEPKEPEPRDEPSPTGWVWIEQGRQRAVLLTPDEIDPDKRYPLVTVLHGAGRQDELLIKGTRDEPEARDAFFLIPRSLHMTWDLIALGVADGQARDPAAADDTRDRPDLDFLEYAYDLIYRRYPVDHDRQALLGYSDGASYGLSIGLSNPQIFRAMMVWAAGFLALDPRDIPEDARKPHVFIEYGTHDELFPFEQVAIPMRETLRKMGVPLNFRVDQGGRHWPSGEFQGEALDWFFSEPWQERN